MCMCAETTAAGLSQSGRRHVVIVDASTSRAIIIIYMPHSERATSIPLRSHLHLLLGARVYTFAQSATFPLRHYSVIRVAYKRGIDAIRGNWTIVDVCTTLESVQLRKSSFWFFSILSKSYESNPSSLSHSRVPERLWPGFRRVIVA